MKKLSLIIASTILVFGMSKAVVAQDNSDSNEASHDVSIDIPSVALVDVEDDNGEVGTLTLDVDVSSLEAGDAPDFSSASDNSLWLNYTSVVNSDGNNNNGNNNNTNSRSIQVEVSEGNLPGGVNLLLSAGAASGNGDGVLGESENDPITLSGTSQDLITGIGSAYTGDGTENGHQLTYSLDLNDDGFSDIVSGNYNVTVTYTITEDN